MCVCVCVCVCVCAHVCVCVMCVCVCVCPVAVCSIIVFVWRTCDTAQWPTGTDITALLRPTDDVTLHWETNASTCVVL